MQAYELAVEALDVLVAGHVDRSRLLRADGLYRDALNEAALALQLDPLNGPALLCHGLALVALDRHPQARRDLEQLWLNHPPLAERLRRVLRD
jgi:tetratricopeptide (TPR) repeat protein